MASLLLNQNLDNRYSIINFGYILRKIGKFGITRHQVFLKFVRTSPPRCRTKKNVNSYLFDVIQDIFR